MTFPVFPADRVRLPVSGEIGWSSPVLEWPTWGNTEPNCGDCALAGVAVWDTVVRSRTGDPAALMSTVEVQHAYTALTGWNPHDVLTNHGARLEDVMAYMAANGWPGDPLLKPAALWSVPVQGCSVFLAALRATGSVYGWYVLPMRGGDWDFTDASVNEGVAGTGAHCMTAIDADMSGVTVVTWGREVTVSWDWFAAYARGMYAMWHPLLDGHHPDGLTLAELTWQLPPGFAPIATAPTDGTEVMVWAAPRYGADALSVTCAYHPDAGWWVCDLRRAEGWRPVTEADGVPA